MPKALVLSPGHTGDTGEPLMLPKALPHPDALRDPGVAFVLFFSLTDSTVQPGLTVLAPGYQAQCFRASWRAGPTPGGLIPHLWGGA